MLLINYFCCSFVPLNKQENSFCTLRLWFAYPQPPPLDFFIWTLNGTVELLLECCSHLSLRLYMNGFSCFFVLCTRSLRVGSQWLCKTPRLDWTAAKITWPFYSLYLICVAKKIRRKRNVWELLVVVLLLPLAV